VSNAPGDLTNRHRRCSPIASVLDDILLHCQNSATLSSAHDLFQTMTSNPKFASALESAGVLNEILEDMGFGGLWRSCSFSQTQEPDKQCFALTEKLIEVWCRDDVLCATNIC
jgi:neurofibromin 1